MPGRGRSSRRGGNGDRGGGVRPPISREVTISKSLSYLLRHGAQKENIPLDEGGWANVQDIVSIPSCFHHKRSIA